MVKNKQPTLLFNGWQDKEGIECDPNSGKAEELRKYCDAIVRYITYLKNKHEKEGRDFDFVIGYYADLETDLKSRRTKFWKYSDSLFSDSSLRLKRKFREQDAIIKQGLEKLLVLKKEIIDSGKVIEMPEFYESLI